MATSRGRKSATKKKEENQVVESPKKEVVKPVAEKRVSEPEPVSEPEHVSEPEQPKAEEVSPPPLAPEEPKSEVEVSTPVVEQKIVAEPRIGIGSIVMTPTGKRCQVVGHAKGEMLKVQNLQNTRKVYAYKPSQLSLV